MRHAALLFLLLCTVSLGLSAASCNGVGGGEVCDDGEDNDLDGDVDCDDPDCTVEATDSDGDVFIVWGL